MSGLPEDRVLDQVLAGTERAIEDPEYRATLQLRIQPGEDIRVAIMEAVARNVCGDVWNWEVYPTLGGKPAFHLLGRR